MGRIEYWDPVSQSRKPAKAGSIVDDVGLEYTPSDIKAHETSESNPHSVTKTQVGLSNVDNVKQVPIDGGTFTGIAKAHSNTSYTVAQLRNVILSASDAVVGSMSDGDIWIKYK